MGEKHELKSNPSMLNHQPLSPHARQNDVAHPRPVQSGSVSHRLDKTAVFGFRTRIQTVHHTLHHCATPLIRPECRCSQRVGTQHDADSNPEWLGSHDPFLRSNIESSLVLPRGTVCFHKHSPSTVVGFSTPVIGSLQFIVHHGQHVGSPVDSDL